MTFIFIMITLYQFNLVYATFMRYSSVNKVLDGGLMDRQEALALLEESDKNVRSQVILAADSLRKSLKGDDVSYVINLNLNFTNICVETCTFCAFAAKPKDEHAYTMSWDTIISKIDDAVKLGATEICIQSGLNPIVHKSYPQIYRGDSITEFYGTLLQSIKKLYPDLHLHAYSPEEVKFVADIDRLSTREALTMLKSMGLDSMPGTAAEILDDEIRAKICPDKVTTQEWVDIITKAHEIGIPTTSTIMFGHHDTPYHIAKHIDILRNTQLETKGFTEFVPLPFIRELTQLGRDVNYGDSKENIYYCYAVFRLFMSHTMPNLQTSWPKLNPDGAAITLDYGVNDFGGTLMEESITRMAGGCGGTYLSVNDIERLIRSQGRTPVQRDTLYNRIKNAKPVA